MIERYRCGHVATAPGVRESSEWSQNAHDGSDESSARSQLKGAFAGEYCINAGVAQLVERLSCKQGVTGSSPVSGFRGKPRSGAFFYVRIFPKRATGVDRSANTAVRIAMRARTPE